MKTTLPKIQPMKKSRFPAGAIAALLLLTALPQAAHAGLYYWDTNGTTAGYGTASGTWGTSANWSTDDSGLVATTAYTTSTSDDINFGAGVTGLAAGTVTVSGTQNAGTLTFASGSGAIVLSGGTAINLPAASTLTVNNASDTITTPLIGAATSLLKTGAGSVILNGANTYTGTTTIGAGTLQLGDGTTGSLYGTTGTALTFTGTGTFNVREAASSNQGMGALTFSGGEGNVLSTGIASQNSTLTFASMAARSTGATANFNIVTNTTTSQNKIVLTSSANAPLSSGSNDRGIFFNLNDGGTTGNYARYDTVNGYFRGTNYPGDTNTLTSFTGTTSSKDIYLASGGTTGGSIAANTIRFTGANLAVTAGTTLSVNGALLVANTTRGITPNSATTYVQPTSDGGEVVLASQTLPSSFTSLLQFGPNIQNFSGGSSPTRVTKAGNGQVVMQTSSSYTGATTINAGVLRVLVWADGGSASGLGASSNAAANLVINGGTLRYANQTGNASTNRLFTVGPNGATLDVAGSTATGNLTIGSGGGNIAFLDSNSPTTLTLSNDSTGSFWGIGTLSAALGDPGGATPGANVTSVIKIGASGTTWQLAGANSYTGNTTILAGNTITLTSTGTLKFAPRGNDICNKVTGAGAANFNGTFNIDTTNADTTNGNSWTLVDVTTKTSALIAVTGFSGSSGVWTKVDGSRTWTYTESTGVLSLVNSGGSFTVTFSNNGGTGTMTPQTGSTATALTSNTFTKTGYSFAGWNTAANGSGTAYADGASYAFTANTTLYAQWTASTYTVTFDGNGGGTPSPTSKSVTYASTYGTLATVTRANYTFNGWFTATSGGTQVTSGSTVAITGAQTLYAQWTINSYTVSFNMNGGSPTISSQSVPYNTMATQPSDPTKTGNTFAGWYSDAGLTTSFSFSTLITADTALYAKWTPVVTHQVTFDSNGGSSVAAQTVNDGSTATQPTAPTLANNSFAGWYTDNNTFANQFNFSTAITGDITLYAKWTGIPAIVLADTLSAVNTTYGTASATPTSFHVSGSFLTGNLTVTPPSGYEVSLSSGSGYSTSLSITASGTLSSTQVYVRLVATTTVNGGAGYTGIITVSGGGASSQTIATASSTVAKADATVVVTPYTVTYDGNPHTATVTSITGVNGETGATVGTVSLNTTHTTAGTYSTDSWYLAGTANYNNIGTTTSSITVANPSFETTGSALGGPWFTVGSPWSITGSPSNYQVIQAVAGGSFSSTVTGGGTYIALINEDDCPIAHPLVQNLNTSVTAGDTLSVTFYIGRQLGAAAGGAGVVYFDVAGTEYTMAFDTSAMTAGTWQLTTMTQTITNSGNLSLGFYGTTGHAINAWVDLVSNVSWTYGSNPQTLTDTINKATPTATLAVNNSPVTYDGTPKAATVGITTSSVPGSAQNILTGGAATQTAAGTYAVTADFVPTDTTNYNTLSAQSAGNFIILTTYNAWANGTFANGTLTDKTQGGNPDSDTLTNLQEYAFGTDPTDGSSGPGSIIYVAGGAVTTPGSPVATNLAVGEGVDYRAVFGRRKDYGTAGLTYTVQFSVDNSQWTNSTDTPTVLTGAGALNPSAVEAVSVPYPLFIPYTRNNIPGYEKPTFFRVGVTSSN